MKEKSIPITASLGFGIIPVAKLKPQPPDGLPDHLKKAHILVVESDPGLRRLTSTRLGAANYQTESVETAQEALDACVRLRPNLVVSDLDLDESDGLALLKELKSRWPELTVIVLADHLDIPKAVQATEFGAFSFLVKPVEKSELLDHVKRAIAISTFTRVNRDWRADMAARSRLMNDRLAQATRAAGCDEPVLLTGKNGTGKELMARAIHAASARRNKPFVTVSCRTAVQAWLEWELFNRESDAADSAVVSRSGAFLAARGGTLLVEEIGNLPAGLQLEFIEALGEVRLICTTSSDLKKLVEIGQLRAELYDRISAVSMEIPPLGRRREDMPLLISHFLEQATEPSSGEKIYSPKDIELLATTGWPENVRQLFDLVKQNVALSQGDLTKDGSEPRVATFDEARERFSRQYLAENLRMTAGNVSQSARLAKRNRTDFYKLLSRYRLRPDDFKQSAVNHANHAES